MRPKCTLRKHGHRHETHIQHRCGHDKILESRIYGHEIYYLLYIMYIKYQLKNYYHQVFIIINEACSLIGYIIRFVIQVKAAILEATIF